jgi:hypothetical protein
MMPRTLNPLSPWLIVGRLLYQQYALCESPVLDPRISFVWCCIGLASSWPQSVCFGDCYNCSMNFATVRKVQFKDVILFEVKSTRREKDRKDRSPDTKKYTLCTDPWTSHVTYLDVWQPRSSIFGLGGKTRVVGAEPSERRRGSHANGRTGKL